LFFVFARSHKRRVLSFLIFLSLFGDHAGRWGGSCQHSTLSATNIRPHSGASFLAGSHAAEKGSLSCSAQRSICRILLKKIKQILRSAQDDMIRGIFFPSQPGEPSESL
jgi:hypothetical protein